MDPDDPPDSSSSSNGRYLAYATSQSSVRQLFSWRGELNKDGVGDSERSRLEKYLKGRREAYRRRRRAFFTRFEKAFNELWQRWIIEFVLRQYPLPPSQDGRHIPVQFGRSKSLLVDERRGAVGKPYISNFIRSSRYSIWNFLPKQLYFQFSKLGNFYFLVVGILQMIPGLSTTGRFTTIGPLIAFVALSMAKEGYDDYRRYVMDRSENRSDVWVLDPEKALSKSSLENKYAFSSRKKRRTQHGQTTSYQMAMSEIWNSNLPIQEAEIWTKLQWQHLQVGDIIRLDRDENLPADVVLLHATGPNGVAYIETMALDGETNLKSKQACPLLAKRCKTPANLKGCNATVVSEDPNIDLYKYEGRVNLDNETMPLTMNEVVYRGSTLRNTASAIGLVINTGEECKIRMNAHKNVHAKAPAMQSIVNRIVLLLILFVLFLTLGLTLGNELWWKVQYYPNAWYLRNAPVSLTKLVVGFITMFNTIIPLSLYVSLEIIKIGQFFLLQDVEMYDAETNTPMVANTTTILENLGQVSYVFSDKTGTLTENKMRFRKFSVAGTAWYHDTDSKADAKEQTEELKGKGKEQTTETNAEECNGRRIRPESDSETLLAYAHQNPNTTFSKKAKQFLLSISLCHTCLPETKENGEVGFQAASPDELALVQAAQELGYIFIDRPAQSIVLRIQNSEEDNVDETYQVLDVIEFSSQRKRMSIILRMPDGQICMFIKGADSAILPLLKQSELARQKSSDVSRKASVRRSMEAAQALGRRSSHQARKSTHLNRTASNFGRGQNLRRMGSVRLSNLNRQSDIPGLARAWIAREERASENQPERISMDRSIMSSPVSISSPVTPVSESNLDTYVVMETVAANEGAIFERCFQHIDDFASEGLRTLLYGYRYIDETDYAKWKKIYQEATTSLVDRQKRIEAAGEMIEKDFELAGATAIEDKLQPGVPETIEKLRRANIKVWMLTGDKRETAINIANSARVCKPFSEVYVLDSTTDDLQEKMNTTLIEIGRGVVSQVAHSVLVVDGHTLGVIEDDEALKVTFFDLVVRIDSVICCRASPAQKATMVKCIRDWVPSSLTLAIGDGANDIAMIQASHVGIGISGREGLQAARISDYSIAQFRFLQRLLLVHGRWNYMRTGKYILGTFFKEILFYLCQAQYQHRAGYTGTSLYENWSLTVFNVLFTSITVIIPGIFDKDLEASTLLAVPELYTYGQKDLGFNFKKYIAWMIMAVIETLTIYHLTWAVYTNILFTNDNTIYAFGQAVFTICVVFINVKMLFLKMHHRTVVSVGGFVIMVGLYFCWNLFLSGSGIVSASPSPYQVNGGFIHNYGRQLIWWVTCILVAAAVIVLELGVATIGRVFFPWDQDVWQEIEQKGLVDRVVADIENGVHKVER